VAAWSPATVRIDVVLDGEVAGGGSGSIIDLGKGLILTNNHVASVGPMQVVNTVIKDPVDAELVSAAPCDDLALIRIDTRGLSGLKQVTFGVASALKQGQHVVALGYPGAAERLENRALSATSGIISKVKTEFDLPGSDVPKLENVIQTDAAINPGNSGGPLFDLKGSQIGVNSAGLAGQGRIENENYAISIDRVKQLLDDLKAGHSPKWIGVTLEPVQDQSGKAFLGIGFITPGGPAEQAGVTAAGHFVFDTIDGQTVRTFNDYCDVMPDDGPVTVRLINTTNNRATDFKMTVGK
jgi:S1-C subfamily serine protease